MDEKIFCALYYDLMDHCVAFTRSTLKEFINDDDLINALDAVTNDLSDDVIETVSKSEADSLTWPARLIEDGSIRFESESLSIIKSTLERIEH